MPTEYEPGEKKTSVIRITGRNYKTIPDKTRKPLKHNIIQYKVLILKIYEHHTVYMKSTQTQISYSNQPIVCKRSVRWISAVIRFPGHHICCIYLLFVRQLYSYLGHLQTIWTFEFDTRTHLCVLRMFRIKYKCAGTNTNNN